MPEPDQLGVRPERTNVGGDEVHRRNERLVRRAVRRAPATPARWNEKRDSDEQSAGPTRFHRTECTNRTTPPRAIPLSGWCPASAPASTKLARVSAGSTMFERVGGEKFFDDLTSRFYSDVKADPLLRPLYPSDDDGFESARRHLRDFLIQYWGGPETYNETRGAPRLRQRHVPFPIGPGERDAWLTHMTAAVRAAELRPLDEAQMIGYFNASAATLTNQP